MDFQRRYNKLSDDLNRVITRAKSTTNVFNRTKSQFDSYCKYFSCFGNLSARKKIWNQLRQNHIKNFAETIEKFFENL